MITVTIQQQTADREGKIVIFDANNNRLATFFVKCINKKMGKKTSKISLVQTGIFDEKKVKVNN